VQGVLALMLLFDCLSLTHTHTHTHKHTHTHTHTHTKHTHTKHKTHTHLHRCVASTPRPLDALARWSVPRRSKLLHMHAPNSMGGGNICRNMCQLLLGTHVQSFLFLSWCLHGLACTAECGHHGRANAVGASSCA
jgi:hypothetical protein